MNQKIDYYLALLSRINSIYSDMLNKKYESYDKLKDINKELNLLKEDIIPDNEIIGMIIKACNDQINIINYLNKELTNDMETIRTNFLIIEKEHYEITNRYIKGIINTDDINNFKENILKFKNILYKFPTTEENIHEIAKMKSKIQHFTTEILEDEDVLRMAYHNSNV